MKNLSMKGKILGSFFASITPRTAGYSTINTAGFTQVSIVLTMILMFIGGSSGSTAGGIKTVTFTVLAITAIQVAKAQSEIHMRMLLKVGADKVVFPEKDMGMRLARSLSMSNIVDYIELSDDYSIVEIKTPSQWVGKTLKQLDIRRIHNLNVMAIRFAASDIIDVSPDPDKKLSGDDVLVLIGSNDDMSKFTK